MQQPVCHDHLRHNAKTANQARADVCSYRETTSMKCNRLRRMQLRQSVALQSLLHSTFRTLQQQCMFMKLLTAVPAATSSSVTSAVSGDDLPFAASGATTKQPFSAKPRVQMSARPHGWRASKAKNERRHSSKHVAPSVASSSAIHTYCSTQSYRQFAEHISAVKDAARVQLAQHCCRC